MSNIEDYNRKITQGVPYRIEQCDTIRGGLNLKQMDKLRNYWAEHGMPSPQQIDEANKKVRTQNGNQ